VPRLDHLDSDELALAASKGDRAATEVLLRREYPRILAACRRVVGPNDAEDAAQEALCAVARGLRNFDGRSRFSTWCYRIATNAAIDEFRRRSRRPTPAEPTDHQAAPNSEVDMVVDKMALTDALAALPEEFRVPIVLRDVIGMDYAEIAETLGIPGGTVRSRIARGRGRLADLLSGNQDPANHVEE
jgi:RNA polymerase sigma-70 factor (ECF subfamily)